MYFAWYKQKGSVLPLLIIFILAVGVIGIFYVNSSKLEVPLSLLKTKQVASKEQIYQNQKLGVELKYTDQELFLKEDSEAEFNKRGNGDYRKNFKGYVGYEPGKFLGAIIVLDKSKSFEINPLTIWVFNNDNNLTIETWYQKYWYYPFVWGDFTYTGKSLLAPKEEATVSGQIAKQGIIDYQPGKPKFIYIAKDQKMYLFRVIGETGEKILQSLIFLQ